MTAFDDLWAQARNSPEYIAEYERFGAVLDNGPRYTCKYGCCTWFYDEEQGEVVGGMGRAGCPCEDESETDPSAMLHTGIEP